MNEYILEMKNISKTYGTGVKANTDVNFNLKKGEIHALVGENGAGKSTLMKILFGMENPTKGELILRGEKVRFSGSKDAISKGIGMVHQHFMLVESFSVAQNIVLGMEPKKGVFVDEEQAIAFTEEISGKYNLFVQPKAITGALPVGIKQKVEILKALARGAKILILDEPTAVLAPQETEQLFEELARLKELGHTIVFISHKIPEIKQISDRVTVIRGGQTVGTYQGKEISEKEISNLIMGCEIDTAITKEKQKFGKSVITVDALSYKDEAGMEVVKNISFGVRQGMVFGIAGVQGNGQVELVNMLTKEVNIQAGNILFKGRSIENDTKTTVRKMKYGYIPEDRLEQGVAAKESIRDNMLSNRLHQSEFCKKGFLNYRRINEYVRQKIKSYEIRCVDENQQVGMLSGGNMQKVVVARECDTNPEILIAEQPTRGVDIGAAHIIHQKIIELRQNNCGVLLISADLNEVLKLSDVIAIMYEGEIVAYFDKTDGLNEEIMGLYMLGIERHDAEQIQKAVNKDE